MERAKEKFVMPNRANCSINPLKCRFLGLKTHWIFFNMYQFKKKIIALENKGGVVFFFQLEKGF